MYLGAWRNGNKNDFKFIGHALNNLRHPVIVPNYRPYPEVQFPKHINGITDAMLYVEKNTQRILKQPFDIYILMGHLAGAHTAALPPTEKNYLQTRNLQATLKGLIAMAGSYELSLKDPEVAAVF